MSFDSRLLSGLSVLAAVVQARSFARAADALGMTSSGVSRAIARLEDRVGVRLLDRTTRSMVLTDEGRLFYEQVAPLLVGIEEAAVSASGAAGIVRGRLRVDIDAYFLRSQLSGKLGGFLRAHPELTLELITREHVGDLVTDGIDLAMRFGEPTGNSAIARKLMDTRVLTLASPGYLRKHGRPKHPSELSAHHCIQFFDPLSRRLFDWEFRNGRKVLPVASTGRLHLTDGGTMINECLAGTGIAQVLAIGLQPLLDSGRLVDLFPDWPGETFPFYALYPSRSHQPAKVRAFVDFVSKVITNRSANDHS
ncbi:LysR family transcriptional regulator [Bradyrhizobium sp. Ce-3]|uniref:LysR family transcriptional regulator n=1 Tax=Bradyrhizobium sp. Ce-3 TaxID=2913970 RepID=UPI001FBAD45A|nr:LysR family transcriptional regulator [Bradyrhizobium sp. Ce-3]GKQ51122.1 transcriptional regulator [Bradyrhizobium sp. Ce-3]